MPPISRSSSRRFWRTESRRSRVEQFRAVLLEVAQDRFREVAEKLLDLAAEGERWAVELVLDRCLGKVVEPRGQPEQAPQSNQINITLPDPPGGRHEVPGLLDE